MNELNICERKKKRVHNNEFIKSFAGSTINQGIGLLNKQSIYNYI